MTELRSRTERGLTERQEEVYRAVIDHFVRAGRWPLLRDLNAVFGHTSLNALSAHLRALEAAGLLRVSGGKAGVAAKGVTLIFDGSPAGRLGLRVWEAARPPL
jgi:hypothetical protein